VARFLDRKFRRQQNRVYGYTAQFEFDREDIAELIRQLQKWPEEVRQKIVRASLKVWGRGVMTSARRYAYAKAHRTKANIVQVMRIYKNTGIVWSAIGVATGRVQKGQELKGRYGDQLPGWRSHLYEVGWTPYAGRQGDEARRKGKGRAWRRGLRKRLTGLPRRYRTQFLYKAYSSNKDKLQPALEQAIAKWVARTTGKAVRRG
jgi:hypothetical protein